MHLDPGEVALVVLMQIHFGVPLEKIVTVLRGRFGLTVTAGGLML